MKGSVALCTILVATVVLGSAAAATEWTRDPATPGDWFEPANWSLGVPGPGDSAGVRNGGTAVIADGDAASSYLGVGGIGSGTVQQAGGTNTVQYWIRVGAEGGGRGLYLLSGGHLSAGDARVGEGGPGSFTHTGGAFAATGELCVGRDTDGTYQLTGAAELTAATEAVGFSGPGLFVQSGGTNTVGAVLTLGTRNTAQGTYRLTGGALLADRVDVGSYGRGQFEHEGGTHTVSQYVYVGSRTRGTGTYELTSSVLQANRIYLGGMTDEQNITGHAGTGAFVQHSGTVALGHALYVGRDWHSQGSYDLVQGVLTSPEERIGDQSLGRMVQRGGVNTVTDYLAVGYHCGSDGTYELRGGSLWARVEKIAFGYMGVFLQTGGSNTVATDVLIGSSVHASGTYEISAGSLTTGGLILGVDGAATLAITGTPAGIAVGRELRFGPRGRLLAVPGSAIRMSGAAFANASTDAAALGGLANLTLIFEGGPAVSDTVEVAGRDFGPDPAGWADNFALHTLQLGGCAAGRVKLADAVDNQPAWEGDEALYAEELVMNPGAALDPAGLSLYYRNGGAPKRFFPGDANLDGAVNVLDLGALTNHYRETGRTWAEADFTGDGAVNVLDLGILANYYCSATSAGPGGLAPGGEPVPEPAALGVLLIGCLALARRGRPGRVRR